jgi:hypothetical protein
MLGDVVRFRVFGRDHVRGDPACSGCDQIDGKQYPRRHTDYEDTCLGLVHAERLAAEEKTIFWCDVCFANPE